MEIFCEDPNRNLVNPIGDEVGGENIDRIMQMAEQDDDAKENGDSQKETAELFVVPKNKRQEERESRMSRKEHVILES